MARWPWWHRNSGPDDFRVRELLRAIWDLHAMYGADEPWLWRGQSSADFNLEPAVHTRARRLSKLTDAGVIELTHGLIAAARKSRLDLHENTCLPDLALLALLQHHGAATPLLDVTLDPIVGLYMAVVSPNGENDDQDGVLFAIKRPAHVLGDFDSRPIDEIYESIQSVALYSAPDVSERLRIQRGHFLLGRVSRADRRVTVPLTVEAASPVGSGWVWKRMRGRGKSGPVAVATSDTATFRVPWKFKQTLRAWLEARSGLTADFIYPTAWHQPHLDRFAASHGRSVQF